MEAGPNPITELADGLEFEGKPSMPPHKKSEWEALGRFRDALTAFLAGKDAAFIGGTAVRSYGGRAGPTVDYDLLIAPELLKTVTKFLEEQTGRLEGSVENTCLFRITVCNIDVDVRVAKTPLDIEALSTAKRANFFGRRLKIVRPAHLAAMKVKAYSERKELKKGRMDRDDVRGLLECGATTATEIRDLLQCHRPDLLPALDEILSP